MNTRQKRAPVNSTGKGTVKERVRKLKYIFFPDRGSLRRRILVFTMSMILISALLIGGSFFIISKSVLRRNQEKSAVSAIAHAAYTVEQDLNSLQELLDYFFVDKEIQSVLSRDIITDYDRTLQWNDLSYALDTYERLECFRYINCILFYNQDGWPQTFYYMVSDTEGFIRRNQELGWYKAAVESGGRLLWDNSITIEAEEYEPYEKDTGGPDISVMRALRNQNYRTVQGAVYASIRPEYLSALRPNNGLEGMEVYLYDSTGRLLSPDTSEEKGAYWSECLENTEWKSGGYRSRIEKGYLIYEYPVDSYGYRFIAAQPLEDAYLMDGSVMLLGAIMLAMMILVAVSLWLFLSRRVIRPVNILSDTMKRVHTEGLSVQAPKTGCSEFDYLSGSLNHMLDQIRRLMESNLEKEREIQETEHRAVLAQINPHFVYNALFAIRMMAVIQKADNIRDMVDALWRMLKNSTSRAKEEFSLADEIQNVKDYIHILSAMNVQKFEVVYEISPELYEAPCPRFLIQPIVENAIMHGVLPKQGFSTIRIHAEEQEENIVITISNDGLPISEERLEEVRQSLAKATAAHKGIGLSSVRRRLILLYGENAGLTITSSRRPEKTIVTIYYPRQKGGYDVPGDHCGR